MKQTPKQFFSTQIGKLTLAIAAMILCWMFFLVYVTKNAPGGKLIPTERDKENVKRDTTRALKELADEEKKLQAFEDLQSKYDTSLTTYWNADRDGEPETELRNLVSEAAQNAKANLQTLGSVRTSTINSELSYADLDFTLVDEYDKVIRFFAEVEKCTPRLSWRRVEIRVEPVRARAVTGPGARNNTTAAATTTPAQMFRTSGQVRVIKYSPSTPSTKTTAKSSGKAPASTANANAPKTQSATTPAATSTPAAQQPPAPAAGAPAAADTPAQKEPAAAPTTNTDKENEK